MLKSLGYLDTLLTDKELPDGRPSNISLWLLLGLLVYLLHLLQDKRASFYEIIIVAVLDLSLLASRDEKDRLGLFHSLPRVFLIHPKNHIFLTIISLSTIILHCIWQGKRDRSIAFFLAITLAIFAASFGTTKIIALSFVTGIMASYMYLWEVIEPIPPQHEEETIRFDQLSTNDDPHVKDQAIAQGLVSKLKRLKAAMIIEQEKNKKSKLLRKEPAKRKIKRTRSRSVADKDSTLRDNSDREEREDDTVIRSMLDLNDLKQLIEILVSHNSQEMKYWLPKDILSVLNNEEVSAYLWAYINTQDMIPSPRAIKQIIGFSKNDSTHLSANSIGEDFNFDLFTFDKSNIHQDSLVIGCTQIYKKFR